MLSGIVYCRNEKSSKMIVELECGWEVNCTLTDRVIKLEVVNGWVSLAGYSMKKWGTMFFGQ